MTLITKHGLEKQISMPELSERDIEEYLDEIIHGALLKGLEKDLDEIQQEFTMPCEIQTRELAYEAKFKNLFPIINPSFLSLRGERKHIFYAANNTYSARENIRGAYNETATPLFATYSLDSAISSITVYGRTRKMEVQTSRIHHLLSHQYTTLLEEQWQQVRYRPRYLANEYMLRAVTMTSTFIGVIPHEVKEIINIAKKACSGHLYLVTEAAWNVQLTPIPGNQVNAMNARASHTTTTDIDDDPLLLGMVNNTCFLLAEFTTTPAEEYVKKKYVSG